jgi:hypothetical protein
MVKMGNVSHNTQTSQRRNGQDEYQYSAPSARQTKGVVRSEFHHHAVGDSWPDRKPISEGGSEVSLSPGDLVEVVNTPPPGFAITGARRSWIGQRGVVLTGEWFHWNRPWYSHIGIHDVQFGSVTRDVATCLLKKISGPPGDVIPTLTDVVAEAGR